MTTLASTTLRSLIAASALVLATQGIASAQEPYPTTAQPFGKVQRQGFLIGFSIGSGSFDVTDCTNCEGFEGAAVDIHLGGMLTPRLGLMFDGTAVAHSVNGGHLTHAVDTIAAQYWVHPRVWVKGGLGFGRLAQSNADGEEIAASEIGSAVMVAAGVEVLQTQGFALDLQLRASAANYKENDSVSMGSLTLGFNWY